MAGTFGSRVCHLPAHFSW